MARQQTQRKTAYPEGIKRPIEEAHQDSDINARILAGASAKVEEDRLRPNGKPQGQRREIYIRPTRSEDTPVAVRWWNRIRDVNHFDPHVATYPTIAYMAAEDANRGALLYVPIQTVYMIDALGPNPDSSPLDLAEALKQFIKVLAFKAAENGVGEIYFPTNDKDIIKLAKMHGFDEIGYPVLRLRVL
jgi:hypothetical protein